MSRIVIDTNVIVSAALWGGLPRDLLVLALENDVVFLSSNDLLIELELTLSKPKFERFLLLKGKTIEDLVDEYQTLVEIVDVEPIFDYRLRDTDDSEILAAAAAGNATHIVTGDKDLLVLETYEGITILSIREYVDALTKNR